MPTPSQTRELASGSKLQGFLVASGLPGGMGTRFQFFKSLAARRSIQPAGSFCKALWLSSDCAAGAETRAAKNPSDNPATHSILTDIAFFSWRQRIGLTPTDPVETPLRRNQRPSPFANFLCFRRRTDDARGPPDSGRDRP